MNKIFSFLLLLLPFLASSQTTKPWEFGGGLNLTSYEGDLHTAQINTGFYTDRPALSAHLRKNLNNNLAGRVNLLAGAIAGSDNAFTEPAWRPLRGVSFKSPLIELSVLGELYPFGLYKKVKSTNSDGVTEKRLTNKRRKIMPFATIGIGGAFASPKVNWNDANGNEYIDPARAQLDKDAKTTKVHFVVPMGGGVRIALKDELTLNLEGALRPTFNDYLDGFSQAGISTNNDWFFTAGIGLSYAFGENKKPAEPTHTDMGMATEKPVAIADRDNDGITDDKDDCPDNPGTRALKGCPDSDRDGVADVMDACPDVPGLTSLKGCPDRDGDGIADNDDACPDLAGAIAAKGCPIADRDKDGIADDMDVCPDMPGLSKWKGCPDTDNDGLPDDKDDCPGIAGPSALKGCPDTDNDGVADREDECPTIPGWVTKKGCPDAPPPAAGVPYKAVYFNSTLHEWQDASIITMNEAVEILKKDPSLKARIEGHTDNTGEEPANDLLSERRAKRVRDYLVSKGISSSRLNFVGFGSDHPVETNDTLEGRQMNRRVEIHFVK